MWSGFSNTFWDETMVDATYQRHDPSTGLTIVKVDESKLDEETRDGLAVAPLGSSYLVSQGDLVVAVGSPVDSIDCVRGIATVRFPGAGQ